MKKALILCCALLLASCIDVDDYGDYWSKMTVDPALAGRWVKMSEIEDDKTTGREFTFTAKDDAYEVQSYKDGAADEDGPLYPVKTLDAGPYKFLASGPEKGKIVRYVVKGNMSTWYVLRGSAAWAFIRKNYPDQHSFYRGDPENPNNPNVAPDEPVSIKQFNDETFAILSAMPDGELYWDPDTRLKKMP
jgi:hypothetical protein